MALNFYGYREENELYPYKTSIDAMQDAIISKKANIEDVQAWINEILNELGKDLPAIIEQVSANTENIAELSGSLDTKISELLEDYVKQEEFCRLASQVSCILDDIQNIWNAIDEISGDTSCDEKINEISGIVDTIISGISDIKDDVEEISSVTESKASIDQLNNVYDTLSAAIETIIATSEGDERSIAAEVLRATNAENDIRNMVTAETASRTVNDELLQGKIDILSGKINSDFTTLSNLLDNEKSTRENIDNVISGDVITLSAMVGTLSETVDTQEGQIVSIIEELENIPSESDVEAIQGELENIQELVNGKADNSKLDELSGKVETLSEEVSEKANKRDLNSVSGAVDELSTEMDEKASQSDLEAISDTLDNILSDIEGKYVEKEYADRVFATKSDYVENSTFTEKVDLLENTITSTTNNLNNLISQEALTRKNADDLLSGAVATSYQTLNGLISGNTLDIRRLDSTVSSHSTVIEDNTTKIGCISSLRGVEGSNIDNYDDSGNGILDVLHREFHSLMENTYGDRGVNGLLNYLTDLENRIKALENR